MGTVYTLIIIPSAKPTMTSHVFVKSGIALLVEEEKKSSREMAVGSSYR
jgi:hypothetical protein